MIADRTSRRSRARGRSDMKSPADQTVFASCLRSAGARQKSRHRCTFEVAQEPSCRDTCETKLKRRGMKYRSNSLISLAGGLGFEPRQAESESAVLPLDDPPKLRIGRAQAHPRSPPSSLVTRRLQAPPGSNNALATYDKTRRVKWPMNWRHHCQFAAPGRGNKKRSPRPHSSASV